MEYRIKENQRGVRVSLVNSNLSQSPSSLSRAMTKKVIRTEERKRISAYCTNRK